MARRASCSAVISFGLVSIPVKFYIAAKTENVSFCLLSPKGDRVEQLYREKSTGKEVARNEMLRGYEVGKNQIVQFTSDEIKALEEKNNGEIEIKEFVPASSVDLLHVETSHHLSPGKGGDKAYTLLAKALLKTEQYAVAQYTARGKQHVVVIRPYQDGLVIHQMFLANEVREFESDVAKVTVKDTEVDMACMLIASLKKDKYDVSSYVDTYKERVEKAVEAKLAGTKAPEEPEAKPEPINDLFAALQASLAAQAKKTA